MPHPSPTADQLERMSAELDRLIRDVRLGARSQHEHDGHVDRAEMIAAGVRAPFRGKARPPLTNPPLLVRGNQAWW